MAGSNKSSLVPSAREALDKFKMEAASEIDVQKPLKNNKMNIILFTFAVIFTQNDKN